MKGKTFGIIIVSVITIVTILFGVAYYSFYKYGTEKGLLEEEKENALDMTLYQQEKTRIELEKEKLGEEEDSLKHQYINRIITHQEYQNKKEEIKSREEILDRQEDELERKYGIED